MKILITGGAGYIGSHTAQALINSGYQVLIVDNLSTGFKDALPREAQFFVGDIRDSQHLTYIMNKEKIEGVIHLAAKLEVAASLTDPLDYYDNNTVGTLSVLKACRSARIDKIVFSSSATVYGSSDDGAFSENCSLSPLHPYAHSKAMSEQLFIDFEKAYGIKSIRLRFFNVAGASFDCSNGPRALQSTHLIKVAAEVASGKRKFMFLYGNDYPTPDGTPIRDYIHVLDLAELHILALKHLSFSSSESLLLNCGYGSGFSVNDVIQTMKAISGVNFPVKVTTRRPGDATRLVANVDLLQETFQWTPRYNDLSLICKSALDWETHLIRKRIELPLMPSL